MKSSGVFDPSSSNGPNSPHNSTTARRTRGGTVVIVVVDETGGREIRLADDDVGGALFERGIVL